MQPMFSASFVILALATASQARQFTVKNDCPFTVWPAMFTDPSKVATKPDHPTGWEQAPGTSVTFSVPDNWSSGRIWGRTDCDFSRNPGPLSCATGGCNGGLECDPMSGTGVPPASLAEWTLSDRGADWYDVSLVDGSNLPMAITTSTGCPVADCPVDLNVNCPPELAFHGPGGVVGCMSACFANLDGNRADSANCCSGSHNKPETCPREGVQFYSYFKNGCPNAYAYAYDEASESALFTCSAALQADYTLTFCP